MRFGACIAIAACAGCGARPAPPRSATERVAIVASERGPHGFKLVGITENGDSQFALVAAGAGGSSRDFNPAISPDGAWVVFASTRERDTLGTSLWIVPYQVEGVAVRLTSGPGIDSHPAWTHDGRAIVFASTRAHGEYDLWKVAIDRGHPVGEPLQLTRSAGHEVMPTVAADGAILYAAVTVGDRDAGTTSRIEERLPDGTIRAVTDGPSDRSPALSPDGTTIVFTRVVSRELGDDIELYRAPRKHRGAPGDGAVPLVALPLTDESDPAWSADGRYVFATSVYKGAAGNVLWSSVVHVDTQAPAAVARILEDRAGANPRLTPALRRIALDANALRRDPEYLAELSKIMSAAIAEKEGAP